MTTTAQYMEKLFKETVFLEDRLKVEVARSAALEAALRTSTDLLQATADALNQAGAVVRAEREAIRAARSLLREPEAKP